MQYNLAIVFGLRFKTKLASAIKLVDLMFTKGEVYNYSHFLTVLYNINTGDTLIVDLSKSNGKGDYQPTINPVANDEQLLDNVNDYISTFYPDCVNYEDLYCKVLTQKKDDQVRLYINKFYLVFPVETSDFLQWAYNRVTRNRNEPCKTCMMTAIEFMRQVMNEKSKFNYTMTPSELCQALLDS